MSEIRKTITLAVVAIALALLAFVTAPRTITPDAFLDRGEPFFPDFSDPNAASTLEVIEFDEESAAAIPFKVTNKDGLWTIPSHHDYPADGKDRLAQTAAGVIGITKDDFRTDNVADHEACGVLDPLDEGATSVKGRGKRVTLRGASDQVLADFIVGKEIPDRGGLRLVRIPDQKRVYAARMDIDISSSFSDWIEKDLLKVSKGEIDRVALMDYTIDERTHSVARGDFLTLTKSGTTWSADGMTADQEIDSAKMEELLRALEELEIVGVRPKPRGLSERLKRAEGGLTISQADLFSLQAKGYYFSRGNLLSNEGEAQVRSAGVTYTLRFGEIVYGRGEAITAGTESSDDQASGPGENRYLFITTRFDQELFPEPKFPENYEFEGKAESAWTDADRSNKALHDAYEAWRQEVDAGKSLSNELNARFAGWYYVISAEVFDSIQLKRADLVKRKEA